MKTMPEVSEVLQRFREAAVGAQDANPEVANRWAAKLRVCYKILRQTEEGRTGIAAFLTDDDSYVRFWAAAHVLQWAPDVSRPVLEKLRDANGPGAFDAKWTLIEYDKGRLSFD